MDCQPPAGTELWLASGHASAMDIDTHQPQSSSLPSPMNCDALIPRPPRTLHERQHFQRGMAGIALDLVDARFEWLSVYMHYSVPAILAAFKHTAEPVYLRGSPSEATVRARLKFLLHGDPPG